MSEFTYDAAVFCLIFGSIFVVFFLIGCIYCYCWKKKIDRRLSRLGIRSVLSYFYGQNLSFYNSAFRTTLRILKIFFSVSDLERENGRPEPVTVDSADTLWCGWCRQVPPFIQTYKTCQCLHFVYSSFHNEKSEITR